MRSYAQNSSKSFIHVTSTQMYRHALSTRMTLIRKFLPEGLSSILGFLGVSLDEHQTFHHEHSLSALRLVGTWLFHIEAPTPFSIQLLAL